MHSDPDMKTIQQLLGAFNCMSSLLTNLFTGISKKFAAKDQEIADLKAANAKLSEEKAAAMADDVADEAAIVAAQLEASSRRQEAEVAQAALAAEKEARVDLQEQVAMNDESITAFAASQGIELGDPVPPAPVEPVPVEPEASAETAADSAAPNGKKSRS